MQTGLKAENVEIFLFAGLVIVIGWFCHFVSFGFELLETQSCWFTLYHSCWPLLGVNLSPVFVNLYFPYAGRDLFFSSFFSGGSSILNSNQHVWWWKEEAMLCEIHMCDFRSQFWWDFLACYTRPVSVHLAMECVSCSFNRFSAFLLSLKQEQNLMQIIFSCIHFPVWPYPPPNNEENFFIFCTGKL